MLALDTEDDSNGNVTIINFFDGNEHYTFTGLNETVRNKAWDCLHRLAPNNVWACNIEYDLVNLFGADWLGKLCTLQYVTPGMMRAVYREARITFYDTLRHWAMKVEEMGEYIGLPKLEANFSSIEYCQRDTEIVYVFVEKMLEHYKELGLSLRCTLPGMALQLFRKRFYPYEFRRLPDGIREKLRQAYYGGRVEVYRLGEIQGKIQHYDVNSLFPSVMKGRAYPVIDTWKLKDKPDLSKEGMLEGELIVSEHNIPVLPYRASEDTIYPHGSVYGSWCYPEVRKVIEDGGKLAKCKFCIEFDEVEFPFDGYIDFCYVNRLKATSTLAKLNWKLMMNSLYGKFGQNADLEIIYKDKEKRIPSDAKHSNVIWSAYVTSYARLALLEHLRSVEPYYTDTDSIFTSDTMETSTELGKLKLEGIHKKAKFIGNKIYVLDNIYKAKGVPKGDDNQTVMGFISTGRAVYRKPTRFRESRRTFKTANAWQETSKEMRSEYRKRKVLTGGVTEPWTVREYETSRVSGN